MPNAPKHDFGEEVENDTRRDDGLENNQQVVVRDFQRGSDRNDEDRSVRLQRDQEMFDARMKRDSELFDARMAARNRLDVAHEDRDGLRFRDALEHSTSIASLEAQIAAVGDEEQDEVAELDDTSKRA